jgi:hypothetical protein
MNRDLFTRLVVVCGKIHHKKRMDCNPDTRMFMSVKWDIDVMFTEMALQYVDMSRKSSRDAF